MADDDWNLFDDEEEARQWVSQQAICPTPGSSQWLICLLDDQAYGIPVDHVVQMVGYTPVTPLPHPLRSDETVEPETTRPLFLAGVFSLHGEIIPVLDWRLRLTIPKGNDHDRSVVVVVRVAHPPDKSGSSGSAVYKQVGLRMDAVSDLRFLDADAVQPPGDEPTTPSLHDHSNLLGVVQSGERRIKLLNMNTLLSREEMLAAIASHA